MADFIKDNFESIVFGALVFVVILIFLSYNNPTFTVSGTGAPPIIAFVNVVLLVVTAYKIYT